MHLINIFFSKPVLFLGVDFKTIHDVLLGGVVLVQFILNSVDRQILIFVAVENILEGVKYVHSKIAFIQVVVLSIHMHCKLVAVFLRALGYSFDVRHVDLSLDVVRFDVI